MIAGVVLAAGASTRLGQPKQLVVVDGEPLVRRAARALLDAGCGRVAVVLGASTQAIAPALLGLRVELIANADWERGMATSLVAASRWATANAAHALVVAVCDQPRLTAAHLRALVDAWQGGATVASRYGDTLGVPALFDQSAFAALAALEGDTGARALLRAPTTIAIDWPDGAIDIDTPADLSRP